MQCALRLWRAVVWHGSCANILSRFRPGPGYHVHPPRLSMISGALFFLLPLNYTRTASPVESFCHNGLVRRQLLEEFRVRLDGCQHLRRQSGRITASGFPALDGVEAGSQYFCHLALRYVQLCPDGFHVCQLVTGDAGRLSDAVFDFNGFFQRCFQLVKNSCHTSSFSCWVSVFSAAFSASVRLSLVLFG